MLSRSGCENLSSVRRYRGTLSKCANPNFESMSCKSPGVGSGAILSSAITLESSQNRMPRKRQNENSILKKIAGSSRSSGDQGARHSVALGMGDPEGSVTLPLSVARKSCGHAHAPRASDTIIARTTEMRLSIFCSPFAVLLFRFHRKAGVTPTVGYRTAMR